MKVTEVIIAREAPFCNEVLKDSGKAILTFYSTYAIINTVKTPRSHSADILSDATIAREQLAEHEAALRPHYHDMQRDIGSLSVEQSMLEDRRRENEATQANKELIASLVATLPLADQKSKVASEEKAFAVDNQATARAIQSNTVWWRDDSPMYVVGERPHKDSKWIDVLLVNALYSTTMLTATFKADAYHRDRAAALAREQVPFAKKDINTMLDEESGQLLLDSDTEGNVTGKVKRTFKATMDGVPRADYIELGISDDDMRSFDVYKHLMGLAQAFDHVPELDRLLEERAARL
jgi:hypothetical protein